MRRLFVFSRKPSDDVLKNHRFLNYWFDYTQELYTDYSDIYTTNMYALRGAQDNFDEIYLDYVQVWPNEKAEFTKKEIRYGHDLCRLLGAKSECHCPDVDWDNIINSYGKEVDFIKNNNDRISLIENMKTDKRKRFHYRLLKNVQHMLSKWRNRIKNSNKDKDDDQIIQER